MGGVLVLNAGSSSIKAAVFEGEKAVIWASAEEIGGAGRLKVGDSAEAAHFADHAAALGALLERLPADVDAVGHRVVHGGPHFAASARVTPEVIAGIRACIPLAPLHNPANLAAIEHIAAHAPQLPQVACFDTAFHATNPTLATRYALPAEAEALGLRRYGFHGISYAALTRALGIMAGSVPRRLLACHLGNGASLCAIVEGRSVATTMGYSPLDGLTMGTRSGGIDGNAVLRLAEVHGIEGAGTILNRRSGLLGLSGLSSDMRALEAADTPEARFAIAHFCYWVVRHAGSMIAAMGGCDAIAFTGGIGEKAAGVRAAVAEGLGWLGLALDPAANALHGPRLDDAGSTVAAWVVPAAEERMIAEETRATLATEGTAA